MGRNKQDVTNLTRCKVFMGFFTLCTSVLKDNGR